jgi:transcriptional regulator with PAS, ATPase and Fis domain
MGNSNWIKYFKGAFTVCNKDGIIVEMNEQAKKTFESNGGDKLLGTNIFDCHPEPSKSILKDIIENKRTNVYTIEKNNVKKLIYQAPIIENGEYKGIVELSLEIPFDMPHFVRK